LTGHRIRSETRGKKLVNAQAAKEPNGRTPPDDAKVILADQALEVTGMGKTLVAARVQRALEFLNVELTGLAEAGYGPETK